VARDFPDLTLILTHAGWPWPDEWCSVLWRWPNVYGNIGAYFPSFLPDRQVKFFDSGRIRNKVLWASNALGVGGHLVLAGIGGGSIDFSWNPLAGEELTYRTVQWGSVPELRDVLTVARRGDLAVRTEPVGFDDLESTLDRLRAGEVDTRAVLTP
jgi:threonine dehydrogenase-like Zn-dependent dehydrogenase